MWELSMEFARLVERAEQMTPAPGLGGLKTRPDQEARERVGALTATWQQRAKAAGEGTGA